MMQVRIELSDVSVKTPAGRALFDRLNLSISREHVALVGRNGVGKSTLLSLLAGETPASSGRVKLQGKVHFVPQIDELVRPMSAGERRRTALAEARASGAEILLLDEPTLHLDDGAVSWLRDWLEVWSGCVLIASHDRRLLETMEHFFVVSESGCHYFRGSLAVLEAHLEREHQALELSHARSLNRLARQEEHTARVANRRARKKRSGRCRELDRATPKIRLNQKRSHAQVTDARLAHVREARLTALRDWTQSTRRALAVSLPLELAVPALPPDSGQEVLALQDVSPVADGPARGVVINLRLGRERLAVIGPNGAGKSSLLEIIVGLRRPPRGAARADTSKIGYIAQGGRNWQLDESLRARLRDGGLSDEFVAQTLVTHKFPLALADRPLRSLSPGERARAALIALFARTPAVEVLVLDEPTFSLDLVGRRALTRALELWRGGLVVTSHDRDFLERLRVDRTLCLPGGATHSFSFDAGLAADEAHEQAPEAKDEIEERHLER